MPSNSPEEYYRRAVFLPFLDSLIGQLNDRFRSHSDAVYRLSCIIPQFVHKYDYDHLKPVVDLYDVFLDDGDLVKSEYEIWKQKWVRDRAGCELQTVDQRPPNALEALAVCNREIFPNIYCLLQIAATLPVTTATAERTFSTMKRIKTYLRSTMTTDRLTGLALLNVHRDIELTPDEVINHFGRKNRRLDFVL